MFDIIIAVVVLIQAILILKLRAEVEGLQAGGTVMSRWIAQLEDRTRVLQRQVLEIKNASR